MRSWLALFFFWLSGCWPRGPLGPIPVEMFPSPSPSAARPLVVVLPGQGDDIKVMKKAGIAAAIQKGWPEADVLLAGLTMDYYLDGKVARRLREEIVEPAGRDGRREIWLAGASLGGAGVLAYEHDFPGDAAGLVLLAPFLGGPTWIRQMTAAGGPNNWSPPVLVPAKLDKDNLSAELWRVVKKWTDPAAARRVWLGCGRKDRFLPGAKLVSPLLAEGHFVSPAGGHDWGTCDQAAEALFARIRSTR
jgi:pimeloyl-ACP methyl ester carboxylesterase